VVISDQATMSANVPFASAIAMFVTVISLTVVGLVSFAGSRSWTREPADGEATASDRPDAPDAPDQRDSTTRVPVGRA
jgi:hypothetical protein